MVSEWVENGNIKQYVLAHPNVNRPSAILGATEGLMYLHSHGLVHGDLRGENILIKKDGTSCIADPGLAAVMLAKTPSLSSPASIGGMFRWMSPELLDSSEGSGLPMRTVCSDRYAFAMVIYEVLTDNIPFHRVACECEVVAQVVEGFRPEIPVDVPAATHRSGLWGVVRECWRDEPVQRPALFEIRARLFAAAEMWEADLGQSGFIDGFVNVPLNVLLSSGDFSDEDSDSEYELEGSVDSFVRLPRFDESGQNLVVSIQSISVVRPDPGDARSSDEESEYHLEPPDFVYAKPKSYPQRHASA